MRVGHGYDAHRFCEGKEMVLGATKIDCDYGFLAHSDGDVLLHAVSDALFGAAGFTIDYVDVTVIAQYPKLSPHIEEMRKNTAAAIGVDVSRLNIKATTEENMGFTGRKEGVRVHAVCILGE